MTFNVQVTNQPLGLQTTSSVVNLSANNTQIGYDKAEWGCLSGGWPRTGGLQIDESKCTWVSASAIRPPTQIGFHSANPTAEASLLSLVHEQARKLADLTARVERLERGAQ